MLYLRTESPCPLIIAHTFVFGTGPTVTTIVSAVFPLSAKPQIARSDISWTKVLKLLVVNRLVRPGSEFYPGVSGQAMV